MLSRRADILADSWYWGPQLLCTTGLLSTILAQSKARYATRSNTCTALSEARSSNRSTVVNLSSAHSHNLWPGFAGKLDRSFRSGGALHGKAFQ